MMRVLAFLLWSVALAAGSYFFGRQHQVTVEKTEQVEELKDENKTARQKNQRSLAAGLRTESAQAKTEQFFRELQTDYANDKRNNPGLGCVLDPVSLRRWNEANTQSSGDATGDPDAALRGDAADTAAGPGRGGEPYPGSEDVPPLQEPGIGLDRLVPEH